MRKWLHAQRYEKEWIIWWNISLLQKHETYVISTMKTHLLFSQWEGMPLMYIGWKFSQLLIENEQWYHKHQFCIKLQFPGWITVGNLKPIWHWANSLRSQLFVYLIKTYHQMAHLRRDRRHEVCDIYVSIYAIEGLRHLGNFYTSADPCTNINWLSQHRV